MSLRLRFTVLILGIIVLPVLVMLLALIMISRDGGVAGLPFEDYRSRPLALLSSQLTESLNSGDFGRMEQVVAPARIAVMDDNGGVLHTNAGPGPFTGSGYIFRLHARQRDWVVQVIPPPVESGWSELNTLPLLPIIPLAATLLFTMLMSLFILRSINRSITMLDRATREIAGGNLDFVLPTAGEDVLASLARSMESMRVRLKEEYSRRDRFIMAVSHDLKTPLAVIDGYLDALDDGLADTPELQAEYRSVIREKTGLLAHRISHLIELARMTTLEWRQTLVERPLRPWLQAAFELLRDEAAVRGRNLVICEELDEQQHAAFNSDMVRRVLENLLDNAWKHSSPGSPVEIRTWSRPGAAFISVSNQGAGIAPEQVKLIFEPFYRGDHGRNSAGFGLGLASVKSIVELHGWDIVVDSVPGGSTSFTLRIPVAPALY